MKIVVTIEIDDKAADRYNASLYDPEYDDPVLGDGKTLVRDVVQESGIDEIVCGPAAWREHLVRKVTATLDGEMLKYPRRR